ncbi:MAG: phosphocholine cytidylyltransferase family protein [Deltaproteobacteria bacterium]|nr:phosphocholine cytidylyltransferase family protein [Deltaproteobacteria bacterium]
MRALILAAGRGERLRPLTDDRPKCLVRLAGKPLLAWQTAALRAAGVERVAVVGGWRADRLRRRGLVRFVNCAWRRTAMVASLLAARRWLAAGPCIVVYGDVVCHPMVLRALAGATADVAITYDTAWRALWRARFARPEDDAESLRVVAGRVRAIGARIGDVAECDGQFMGLLRLTPRGLGRIAALVARLGAERADRLETTALLASLVARGVAVEAIPVRGRWCEVDRVTDLGLYERRIATGRAWRHDWRPAPSRRSGRAGRPA